MPRLSAPIRPLRALARAASVVAVVVHCGTAWAGDPAEDGQMEHNPTVVPPQGTSSKLMLAGAAITVGWYGVAVGTSYLWTDSPGAQDLRVPVAGPLMALTKTRCGSAEGSCNTFTLFLRTLLTSLSAVGQLGGVAMLGEALLFPSSAEAASRMPTSVSRRRQSDQAALDTLSVVPLVTEGDGVGFALNAQF